MNSYKITLLLLCICLGLNSCAQNNEKPEFTQQIPLGENSWISHNQREDGKIIKKEGIRNWNGSKPLQTYFRTEKSGEIKLGLNIKSVSGNTRLKVSLGENSKEVTINNKDVQETYLGDFELKRAGYQQVTIEVVEPQTNENVEINELLLGGAVTEGEVNFVKDNFHFGRRGPSVHLRYPIPEESKKPTYFYNEIVVPEGEDVIGSYYMANGFAHGYFGIQVNSEKERRVLFSVWSPYDTQDPSEIPDDQRIVLLEKGDKVNTGEFGNEGSGGQSYKRYMWKTGNTYRFLLKGEPAGSNHTDYTAYFFAPEKEKWELIASFRRPKAGNYLGSLYSFLENFVPATGDVTRKANYRNQWVYDKDKGWLAINNAIFSADATADQKDRLDYAGGETKEGYFLKNCGFFDNYTKVGAEFKRKSTQAPEIDFEKLP